MYRSTFTTDYAATLAFRSSCSVVHGKEVYGMRFPVNFMKFSGKSLTQNTSAQLLLGKVFLKLRHIRKKRQSTFFTSFLFIKLNACLDFLCFVRRFAAILFSNSAKLPRVRINPSRMDRVNQWAISRRQSLQHLQ